MSQKVEITALPQLTRDVKLELRKRVRRSAPTVIEQDGKFVASRAGLCHSGATREEAISLLKLAETKARKNAQEAKVTARKAAGKAPDDDEDDEDPEDDDEGDGDDERDADSFDVSFSSETPVERWFGKEILDHSAGAIDMSRASQGLAYLVDHDTGDQVGIIENLRTAKKKLQGTVRFSRSQRAQDIKRDLQDGIRPFTSIGYRVSEMVLEKSSDAEGDTYRCTKWTPMEGSTVAVPADVSVGLGRSAGTEKTFPVQVRSAVSPVTAPPAASAPAAIHVEVRTMNPKETAEVLTLCDTHGIDRKRAAEMIARDGMTVALASSEILADVAKRKGTTLETIAAEHTEPLLELTQREAKEYSICRGITTLAHNMENSRNENSFELEISETLAKRHEGKNHNGLFVPYKLDVNPNMARMAAAYLQRAGIATALTAGSIGQGKELVFTEPGSFIQFLYNRMRLKELGAQTIAGLVGNVAFPKQTGTATGAWVGENPGVDVADSNLTLQQVTTSPKTYQSSTSYSRQLLAQAVIDIDNLVRMDLGRVCALAIDLAGITGAGPAYNQPLGILNTTGVQDYTVIADSGNGGAPAWTDVTYMQELLEDVNADQIGDFSWLTTPGIKGTFKRTPRLLYNPAGGTAVNVTGDPIWSKDNEIDGLMARSSNQVPKNLVTGSNANCHALICGVFGALVNGLWGSGFELVVDPYRLKKQGLIELTTFMLTDWANRYPVGFAVAADCTRS